MLVRSNAVELPLIPFYTARFPTTLAICPSVKCQHSVMLSIVRICSFLQTKHMLCCILSLVTFQLHTDSFSTFMERDGSNSCYPLTLLLGKQPMYTTVGRSENQSVHRGEQNYSCSHCELNMLSSLKPVI